MLRILSFLGLTFGLSAIFWTIIARAGTVNVGGGAFTLCVDVVSGSRRVGDDVCLPGFLVVVATAGIAVETAVCVVNKGGARGLEP
jgi:hypothetical protein